jgi:GNAT superfamily N-acetyltransferase
MKGGLARYFYPCLLLDSMSEGITFREYEKKDFERCVEITARAWPELTGGRAAADLEGYLWPSTWRQLACMDNVPVGLLFGTIYSDLGALRKMKGALMHATVNAKVLLGLYGKTPDRLAWIMGGIATEKDIKRGRAEADGKIDFFVIDPTYRGKGIGKDLLQRFVEHATSRGASRISVDSLEFESWRFYVKHGFTKLGATFRDALHSRIRNEDVEGYQFVMDIRKKPS